MIILSRHVHSIVPGLFYIGRDMTIRFTLNVFIWFCSLLLCRFEKQSIPPVLYHLCPPIHNATSSIVTM